MILKALTLTAILFVSSQAYFAQAPMAIPPIGGQPRPAAPTEQEIQVLSKYATALSKLDSGPESRATGRLQRLLAAFDIFNRASENMTNLQKQRFDLLERRSRSLAQLAVVEQNLLPESVDRFSATRGSLNAEKIREMRRAALNKEHLDLTGRIAEIDREVEFLDEQIRLTREFIRTVRLRLLPAIEEELEDL
jgi:hypothetical protein